MVTTARMAAGHVVAAEAAGGGGAGSGERRRGRGHGTAVGGRRPTDVAAQTTVGDVAVAATAWMAAGHVVADEAAGG